MSFFQRYYVACCKLQPKQSSYWYDLSLAYFYQSLGNLEQDLILKSLKCVQHASYLQADNCVYWNFMGVLYASRILSYARHVWSSFTSESLFFCTNYSTRIILLLSNPLQNWCLYGSVKIKIKIFEFKIYFSQNCSISGL